MAFTEKAAFVFPFIDRLREDIMQEVPVGTRFLTNRHSSR